MFIFVEGEIVEFYKHDISVNDGKKKTEKENFKSRKHQRAVEIGDSKMPLHSTKSTQDIRFCTARASTDWIKK